MNYLILGAFTIVMLLPLILPWGNKLVIYGMVVWFLLWLLFFVQTNLETSPSYDAGILSGSVWVGFSIVAFVIILVLRGLAQYIWCKVVKNRSHQ